MKRIIYFMLAIFLAGSITSNAQVTIGAQSDPQAFSVLELISEGKRGLRLPQLTTEEKEALTASEEFNAKKTTDARGLMIFNKDTKCVEVWSSEKWISRCEEDQYICDTPETPGAITFTGISNALNLNETFTAKVTAVDGMTYTWTVPHGMEITTDNNNQITVAVVKAGSYPLNLIAVTATNDCGNTSASSIGDNASTLEVNGCTEEPLLIASSINANTIAGGVKSGLGTEANPYVVNVGQVFTLSYTALTAGEEYAWSLNSNGENLFTEEDNVGPIIRLRAKDVINETMGDAIELTATNECGTSGRTPSLIYIKIEAITFPTITGVADGFNCGEGNVDLSATASSGAEVRWYDTASSTELLHAGNNYTTSSLTESRYYYVEAYNPTDNTTSLTRSGVYAEIRTVPSISWAKDASRAGAGTADLSDCATTSTNGANVRYFSEATGGNALNNNTTGTLAVGTHTFYAEAYAGTCTSERIEITVTVTPGTGLVITPDPTGTILPAEGTEAERTSELYTASNPDCLTAGSYNFQVIDGSTYASIASSNTSAGTFTVRFETNTSTAGRAAVVRVTDPCNNAKTFVITQEGISNIPVESISISPTRLIINGGGNTETLTAIIYPENATNQNVTWSSDDESIVTVDPNTGAVTSVALGMATITATTEDGNKIATCRIGVDPNIAPNGWLYISNKFYTPNNLINEASTSWASGGNMGTEINSYYTAENKPLIVIKIPGYNSYDHAITYCELLGARLPNIAEGIALGDIFDDGVNRTYWTSTSDPANSANAWMMNYSETGKATSVEKSTRPIYSGVVCLQNCKFYD